MAQPLRRQIFTVILILTLVVYAALGYGAYLTYNEHVRQLAAETRTMAATVAVYVNRNFEAADAVAVTASRHPSMRALDSTATTEVLLPLIGGRDRLFNNALMADTNGQVQAWARPPNAKVEGLIDSAWLKSIAETGQMRVSPTMLGGPGDFAYAIMLGYPITALDNTVAGVVGLSVSYNIIHSHSGRIGYRRAPAGGAVFFFELPMVPADTA